MVRDEQDDRPLPQQNRKAKTDEGWEKSSKASGNKEERSSDKRSEIPCRYRSCQNPSCKLGHPPVCQDYKSETGCRYGRKCFFRHVEAEEKPSKKSKKGGAKGSVWIIEGVSKIGLCISRKSIPREKGKLGSKHAVKSSKSTWHQNLLRERKGPSQGIIPQSLRAKSRGKSTWGDLAPRKMRPQSRMGLGEECSQAQECGQSYILFFNWCQGNAGTYFKKSPQERDFVVDSEASMHLMSTKGWSSDGTGYFAKIQEPNCGAYSQRRSAYKRGSTSIRSRPQPLRDSAITRRNGCCSITWKTLRRPRIFLWVGQRSKKHSWPKRWRQVRAKRTTSYLLLFQGYPPFLVAIRRQHRHCRSSPKAKWRSPSKTPKHK